VLQYTYNLNKLFCCVTLLIFAEVSINLSSAHAKDYFNPNALSNVDDINLADLNNLEQFSSSGSQLPGHYNVNIVINDKSVGLKDIDFVLNDKTNQLEPILTKQLLIDWGVKTDAIPTLKNLSNDAQIIDLGNYIEYATSQFIFPKQILKINIPQIALNISARDSIDPNLFDQGVPALLLNYDFTGARTWYKNNGHQDDRFLSLRSGVNLGAWRLRNYSTLIIQLEKVNGKILILI